MITYVISTIRHFPLIIQTIYSIKALGSHDYEILVVSPHDYTNECNEIENARYIVDDRNLGSVGAYNKGVKEAKGDWVFLLSDDFSLMNINIEEFQDFLNSERMQKKDFKMFSPHPRSGHLLDGVSYETPIHEPYQVMHFPCIAKETINDKLGGVIWNERFRHGYVDHWLGFYASKFETFEPYNYNLFKDPADSFIRLNEDQYRNHAYDNHDYNTLDELYKEFLENENLPYNALMTGP